MKLFYHRLGEGEPLIILHGLFGISDNWVGIARRLAKQYKVFLPDLRNHGRSPHSTVFNYYAMVDDILEFYEEHNIEKALLIGHSMGGKLAMNLAIEHPALVEKLMVVDISPRTYPYRQQHVSMINAMNGVDFGKLKTRGEVDAFLANRLPDEKLRLFVLKNLHRMERGRLGWRLNVPAIEANLENIFETLVIDGVYYGESLFVKGGESEYIAESDYPLIKKYFPNAVIEIIEGASHWVHSDKPDELCGLLSDFLGKACSQTTA